MSRLDRDDVEFLASHFYDQFLPFFTNQPEGSIKPGTKFVSSKRMTTKIGLAMLFDNTVKLNESYFLDHPHFIPYTVFHEMTHLWLYHSGFDPGHTHRFYKKMDEYTKTGYLVDPEVHVHTRMAAESRFVYRCSNCLNRWHVRDMLDYEIFCGQCWKTDRKQFVASLENPGSTGPLHNEGTLKCA